MILNKITNKVSILICNISDMILNIVTYMITNHSISIQI
jgi:hypothetical protein